MIAPVDTDLSAWYTADDGWLKPPFPWFGGKSRAAALMWERLGQVANIVIPFAGSLGDYLRYPYANAPIATLNDRDAHLANFWRAVQAAPDEVAEWADYPVSEPDLHARHLWLVTTGAERVERLTTDPDYYDAKVAGWWVWGICQWIGSGWCHAAFAVDDQDAGSAGMGVHRQLPHLGDAGRGVHRRLPHLGDAGIGDDSTAYLIAYMRALQDKLRRARVCCGDWTRVLGPTPTEKNGLTAVILDPPYDVQAGRADGLYAVETNVSEAVREWAIEHGDNPLLRICLCGYDTEHGHAMPERWQAVPWKARGGYGSQSSGRGRANAAREVLWFSPHCLRPDRRILTLFDMA